MRIQLLSINFEPEPTGIAPYSTGLARHLSAQHEVTVITGVPHYPDWQVPADERAWRRDQTDGRLRVVRLRHFVPGTPGVIGRLGYELSWSVRAAGAGRRIPTDAVIAVVPALFGAHAARLIARHHRAALGIVVQDIMGAAAAQSGVRGGSLVSRMTSRVESSALAAADAITTIHPRLATELERVTEGRKRPHVIYNWTHFAAPSAARTPTRDRHGWRDDDFVVLHSGNMGAKQSLEVVVDAARLAAANPRIRFVLAGGGSRRAALERYAAENGRVEFLGLVPDDQYMDLLAAADVLLVNERPGMQEMSMPSKLTSYLIAGRPIVAATNPAGATAEFVRATGGGLVTPAGDPAALLDAILTLDADPELGSRLATAGRRFAEDNLDEKRALVAYDAWIDGLLGASSRGDHAG